MSKTVSSLGPPMMVCQLEEHSAMTLRCDNEPVLVQVWRMRVNARFSMGLATKVSTPMQYSHSNSLVENVVGRARALAGSLMFAMSEKLVPVFSQQWTVVMSAVEDLFAWCLLLLDLDEDCNPGWGLRSSVPAFFVLC